ncbi:hypothetical protein N2152v2_005068 [Parachlorella kessleri]
MSSPDFSPWQLFVTSATPVVQLGLLAAVGALLAHQGTLNQAGCQVLARMCFYVFTPALTFSKLAQAISIESVKALWPLLCNMTISIAVGLVVGLVMAAVLRTPAQYKPHVIAAIAFGNDTRAMFYGALGARCEEISIAYIAFDIAVATIFQFGIALHFFRHPRPAAAALVLEGEGLVGSLRKGPLAKQPTVSDLLARQRQQQQWESGGHMKELQQQGQDESGSQWQESGLLKVQGAGGACQSLHVQCGGGSSSSDELFEKSPGAAATALSGSAARLDLQTQFSAGLPEAAGLTSEAVVLELQPAKKSEAVVLELQPVKEAPFVPGQPSAVPGQPHSWLAESAQHGVRQQQQQQQQAGGVAGGGGQQSRHGVPVWGSRPDLLSLAAQQGQQQGQQQAQQEQWWHREGQPATDWQPVHGAKSSSAADSVGGAAERMLSDGTDGSHHSVDPVGPRQQRHWGGSRHGGYVQLKPQEEEGEQQQLPQQAECQEGPPLRFWGRAAGRALGAWWWLRGVDWKGLMPLPTQASILGIVVGCIQPAKALLYGDNPPLRAISGVLTTLGSGLIPSTIPLLGALLYRGPGESSQLPWRVTLGVLITRLVLQPILLTGLVVLLLKLGFYTSPDPVFLFTVLLANTTPTAINMQTITVLYQNYPGEMSTILFWQYLASLVTLPAFTWWFLRIIAVWQPNA